MKNVLTVFDSYEKMREYINKLSKPESNQDQYEQFIQVNTKSSKITYCNGVTEQCVVLKEYKDYLKICGWELLHVTFIGEFSEDIRLYTYSRVRQQG